MNVAPQHRVALVTGAGGGIGSAVAAAIVRHGGRVIVTGRNMQSLMKLRNCIDPSGDTVLPVAADITDTDDRQRLCEAAKSWNGGVNVLINNAGVADFGLFADEKSATIDQAFDVNVLAPMHLCRDLLSHLRRQPQAHIVNVGSVFGAIAYPGHAVYSASKFALRGFSEALRRELADTHVRVHYLAPRATQTTFNSAAVEELNRRLGVSTDSPERVAAVLIDMLAQRRAEAVIGWPEKFFARLNALLPSVVDRALAKQLPTIRRFAVKPPAAAQPLPVRSINRRAS